MQTVISELSEKNLELERRWELLPPDQKRPEAYRREKKQLLDRILAVSHPQEPDRELLALYKLGVTVACQAVRTQIAETFCDGYHKTTPSVAGDSLRADCVRAYEQLLSAIRTCDRMYIPDPIERTAPDAQKRLALLRLADAKRQQTDRESRSNNKNINKLFGSRG